ncbi:metallophosphoesterase family protein [Mesobacillus harenae]|uniref:metallophosphoesterase family protein n=1 Tax=Mesobacillus harenae TaxID=2213203 RepID=UPI0015806363|nr:DNA repair exonuclease [Mesobacillus harenae]
MKAIKFIHAADLHLDSPMVGLRHLPAQLFKRLQESTFTALENIINAAIRYEVDFVILAGDLFDGEDRSIRAQSRLMKELGRLSKRDIPVYLVHGNHDHLGGSWVKMSVPENVHVFLENVETKFYEKNDGTAVHLYGFSYSKRHVEERMIDYYEREEGADFHIGILHGHYEGSSQHGKYAPFFLKDLTSKRFDYWALGHIHQRLVLSEQPPIIYPGNPQGRNRKEQDEKGCYLVDLSSAGCSTKFINTADIVWKAVSVDCGQVRNYDDLYKVCRDIMEETRQKGKGTLLSLHIKDLSLTLDSLTEIIENGELLEILNDEEKDEASFVWVFKSDYTEAIDTNRDAYKEQGDFYSDLFSAIDRLENIDEPLEPLFQHSSARRYLSQLSADEKAELLNQAEKTILQLLHKSSF